MKNLRLLILISLLAIFGLAKGEVTVGKPDSGGMLQADGMPMLILGGELGNSAATCAADIKENIGRLKAGKLNTVLVPAGWDMLEPREGEFDFTIIDDVILAARDNGMKVVFLWFGAWKNSMSCYAPEWVKRDTKRFPRARTQSGKPLEILSAFSDEVQRADLKAFRKLLGHIRDTDSDGTVIMVQVENEIGMLEDARDWSDLAEAAYRQGVPAELTEYLKENEKNLHPLLRDRWTSNGKKAAGSWPEVFGNDIYSDEYFMAWSYGRYVERLASAGKQILKVPFYLNAALNSRGRTPGEYPSAGPLAHLKDIWHAASPSVDFLSPDIYDSGFEDWVGQYALSDNRLFIPEVRRDKSNPAQAYYIVGHHNAIGISPFAIENGDDGYFAALAGSYGVLQELTPILTTLGENAFKEGVLLTADRPVTELTDGETRITLSHFFTLPWDPRAADKANWNDAGAIIMKIADEEYLLAGSGVVAKFEDIRESGSNERLGEDGFAASGSQRKSQNSSQGMTPRVGLATVEEVRINSDGTLSRVRTFNGDETHQGRHVRIGVDDHKILHIKTYKYE